MGPCTHSLGQGIACCKGTTDLLQRAGGAHVTKQGEIGWVSCPIDACHIASSQQQEEEKSPDHSIHNPPSHPVMEVGVWWRRMSVVVMEIASNPHGQLVAKVRVPVIKLVMLQLSQICCSIDTGTNYQEACLERLCHHRVSAGSTSQFIHLLMSTRAGVLRAQQDDKAAFWTLAGPSHPWHKPSRLSDTFLVNR